jgi:hypothetical protein
MNMEEPHAHMGESMESLSASSFSLLLQSLASGSPSNFLISFRRQMTDSPRRIYIVVIAINLLD